MFFVPSAILAFLPNPIVSTNEAWFLSNTEKVHGLFWKINEVIKKVNSYEELFSEIKDILTDFDDTVKEAVEEYIEEMYENGELGDIIERYVKLELLKEPTKSFDIDFYREFRKMYSSGLNDYYNQDTPPNTAKTYAQGCTHLTYDGREFDVFLLITNNIVDTHNTNNNGRLVIYEKDNGAFANRGSVTVSIGHGNSIAYNNADNYLYIAHSTERNNGANQNVKKISRILITDLLSSSVASFETHAIINGDISAVTRFNVVSCYNGEIYIGDINYSNRIFKYQFGDTASTDVLEPFKVLNFGDINYSNLPLQDMCVTRDYIYVLSTNPNKIFVFDKENGVLNFAYNIPTVLHNQMYKTFEPEAFTIFDNGNMYLYTGGHTVTPLDFNCWDMVQVFKNNINNTYYGKTFPEGSITETRRVNVNVKHNEYHDNPDGSTTKPFTYPQEALLFIEHNPRITAGIINMLDHYAAAPLVISMSKPVEINGDGIGDNVAGYTIGSVQIYSTPSLKLSNLKISSLRNYLYDVNPETDPTPISNTIKDYVVAIMGGSVYMENVELNADITGGNYNKVYGIRVTRANIVNIAAAEHGTTTPTWNGLGSGLYATRTLVNAHSAFSNDGTAGNVINEYSG